MTRPELDPATRVHTPEEIAARRAQRAQAEKDRVQYPKTPSERHEEIVRRFENMSQGRYGIIDEILADNEERMKLPRRERVFDSSS